VSDRKENGMNALHNNAHWLLRIALASVFLFHGFGKAA